MLCVLTRNRSCGRGTQAASALVLAALFLGFPQAYGASLRLLQTDGERLLEQAEAARTRGDLNLASALLEDVAQLGGLEAEVAHQRGLIAMDRGKTDRALELLDKAASLDSSLGARLDAAGLLVKVGRWPQAVLVLREGFDERGPNLPVANVLADPRFTPLKGFEPFEELVRLVRDEQAGPIGRVLLRLEAIESSLRSFRGRVDRATQLINAMTNLLLAPWTGVALLVMFSTLAGLCLQQMRLVPAPWSLLLGLVGACGIWHLTARLVTAGDSNGSTAIVPATLIVALPTLSALVWRYWRGQRRHQRAASADLAWVADWVQHAEAIAALGKEALRDPRPKALRRLRQAVETAPPVPDQVSPAPTARGQQAISSEPKASDATSAVDRVRSPSG